LRHQKKLPQSLPLQRSWPSKLQLRKRRLVSRMRRLPKRPKPQRKQRRRLKLKLMLKLPPRPKQKLKKPLESAQKQRSS